MKHDGDPLSQAHYLLAEIEAETLSTEHLLHQMLTDGIDHFRHPLQEAPERMSEATLGPWTQEQIALSSLQEASGCFGTPVSSGGRNDDGVEAIKEEGGP
ncbi:MAG: hypothetical protein HYZ13_09095 [Acidobacteria bacterium]|nr:hypothetical protein [Acidobacteriota bacterium]